MLLPDCCGGISVPVCLHSSNTGNTLTRFNLVNNSDPNGHFSLYHEVTTIIRESVIVLNITSNTHKMAIGIHEGAVLQIEGTIIVTSIPIKRNQM